MPDWTPVSDDELDLFLAHPLHLRCAALAAMSETRRLAYAVAYARRSGMTNPWRATELFDRWIDAHLKSKAQEKKHDD